MNNKVEKIYPHLKYEIDMFRLTTNALHFYSNNVDLKQKQFYVNVLLESFAIHTYNLYKFFYQGKEEKKNNNRIKRRSSDSIAEDFNIKRKYFRNNRSHKKNLKIVENKRNKQIAHLTYNRIYTNKKTKPWDFGKISEYMEKTINVFIKSLPLEYKKLFK